MANRIKGITIEIGGDTTKLQKSLSSVDKSLRTTENNLKDINKLLKLDPANTELLTQKQKNLEKAIGDTKTRLKELKNAQSQFDKGSEEWDTLQREITETEQKLKSLEQEYRDFGSVVSQQMKVVGDKVKSAGQKVSDFGQKLVPVSTAAAAVGAGLLKLGYNAAKNADELSTLSKQTGISTSELQKMQYAADLVDVSVEDITGALKKMKAKMDPSNESFKKLGISVTNADGSLRDATDVFYDCVEALSKIDNETERDQAAMELFGKSADSLAGIVDDGGEALKAYGKEAENLGLILDDDTISALNDTNDTIDKVKNNVTATLGQVGADVAETLGPALEKAAEWIGGITAKLRELTPEQTETILKIAGIVAAIAPLLIIGGKIISGIGTLITVLGTVVGVLGGPVTLAIAAVIAIGVLLYKNWDKIVEFAKKMRDGVVKAWNVCKTKVVAAATAIKTKASEAWSNLKTSVVNTAENIRNAVVNKWSNLKSNLSTAMENIRNTVSGKLDAIKQKWQDNGGGIEGLIKTAGEGWKTALSTAYDGLNTLTGGKLDDLKSKFSTAFDNAKTIVSNALETIKGLFNFQWSFPHINLPHFSWEWTSIGNVVKIPKISVSWYKKAYENPWLFTRPTIIGNRGFGDGGGSGELLYGRDQLLRDIAQAKGGDNININVYASDGMNVNQLADRIQARLALVQRQKAAAYA